MSVGNYNYLFKFIIVGDTFVGKSNLLIQYTQRKFKSEHEITIGVEFMAKNIIIDGKNIRIQVWDTAGQEAFRSITRSYYKNSACAVLAYDTTNRDSFDNIDTWLKECREMSPKTVFKVLVGNKCDLVDKRQVSFTEGEEFAKKNDMLFFETSALTGYNVDNLFYSASKEILDQINNGLFELKDESCGIKIGTVNNKGGIAQAKKKKCCK